MCEQDCQIELIVPGFEHAIWWLLRCGLGEWLGGHFANEIIVISKVIEDIIQKQNALSEEALKNERTGPKKNSSGTSSGI